MCCRSGGMQAAGASTEGHIWGASSPVAEVRPLATGGRWRSAQGS